MTSPTQKTGFRAEELAEQFLQHQGLISVARNVHFKTGEIDLVMRNSSTLIFIEVRYRKNRYFGSAAESITPAKQKKLIRSALLYCQKNRISTPWRIDVVAITASGSGQPPEINWIPSAITT